MRKENQGLIISKIVLLTILITFSIFTSNCTKEGKKHFFICLLGVHYQEASLYSDPIADPAQSEVVISWDGSSHIVAEEEISDSIFYFRDILDLDTLESYTLELTTDVGHCKGTVTIPGATYISKPPPDTTLPLGSNIFCDWSTSYGAFYYWVKLTLEAYDSNGSFIELDSMDNNFENNYTTISSNIFNTPDAEYYIVHFRVFPHSQAPPMDGTINGRLFGEGQGDSLSFYVGEPVKRAIKTESTTKLTTRRDFLNAYLETLRIEEVIRF